MQHTRGYLRRKRLNAIARKKALIKKGAVYWNIIDEGYLSKGKIHCSCPMCRSKFKDIASISDRKSAVLDLDELHDNNIYNSVAERTILNRVHQKKSYQAWRRPAVLDQ